MQGEITVYPIGLLDGINPGTLLFLAVIAVLLFGEQLPDVARKWGKKFNDFRKSIQSIQDEIRSAAFSATSEIKSAMDINTPSASSSSSPASSNGSKRRPRQSDEDYEEATAPKFVPPPREPE
jgi:sec-independent protein translocase protein TatA